MNETLITAIAGLLTTFSAWFFTRKKNNAETKKSEVEVKLSELSVVEDAIKIWRETAESLSKKVTEISNENEKLRCEIRGFQLMLGKIQSLLEQIRPDNINEIMLEIKKVMGHA
jgi:predicted  nucleic acid-binding Zn-ribbon protein